MEKYDNRVHRTIGKRSTEVNKANEKLIATKFTLPEVSQSRKTKFQISDQVHLSRYKHVLEEGFTINWTPEIFTVRRVAQTDPVTYHLQDSRNEKSLVAFTMKN